MTGSRAERFYRLFPLLVALLAFAAFIPALGNDFVNWDDDKNFLQNPNYRGLGWPQLHWMWTSYLMGRYIPITWMTLGLDYKIWGMEAGGYHFVNLLWHAATAVVFYFMALALFKVAIPETSELLRSKSPLGALAAALFFAVHPLRVESVAWATERRDVVSGFFFLFSILVYLRGFHRETLSIDRKHYWRCFGLFILALLSKEIAVTLPIILLILDFYPLRRLRGLEIKWNVYLEKLPFVALSVADSILALYVGTQENLRADFEHLGWFSRLAISVYGLGFYIWKTVLPFHLAPFYAITAHRLDPHALPFQMSAVLIAWITAAALLYRRKIPAFGAAWLSYIVLLIPVLGLFHNGQQIAADRYSYLACLSWAILGGYIFMRFLQWRDWRKTVAAAAAILLTVGLGVLTWRQTEVWKNSETLWEYTATTEGSFIAYNNIGNALLERGDDTGALDNFKKSIELDPTYALAHNNAAAVYMQLGDLERAVAEFQAAIQLKPGLANAHGGLGAVLATQGKLDDAIRELRLALQLNPNYESAREELNRVMQLKNQSP